MIGLDGNVSATGSDTSGMPRLEPVGFEDKNRQFETTKIQIQKLNTYTLNDTVVMRKDTTRGEVVFVGPVNFAEGTWYGVRPFDGYSNGEVIFCQSAAINGKIVDVTPINPASISPVPEEDSNGNNDNNQSGTTPAESDVDSPTSSVSIEVTRYDETEGKLKTFTDTQEDEGFVWPYLQFILSPMSWFAGNDRARHEIEEKERDLRRRSAMYDENVDEMQQDYENLNAFRESIQSDSNVLRRLWNQIDCRSTERFVNEIIGGTYDGSRVFITGIGKSGIVGERFAASLSSVSIPSEYVHTTEWAHGDLGKLIRPSIVIGITSSGRTSELLHAFTCILNSEYARHTVLMAIVCQDERTSLSKCNAMTKICDHILFAGREFWAESNPELRGKIPTRSIIIQETIVNAIVSQIVDHFNFSQADFIKNHPGGAIGASGKK